MALTIELRSYNVPLSVALREHVARRVDFAVGRFAPRLERIVVRVSDPSGGGPDKRCRMRARLSPDESIVVEATDSDAYAAVSQAAIRLDEHVARALSRARARRSRGRPTESSRRGERKEPA